MTKFLYNLLVISTSASDTIAQQDLNPLKSGGVVAEHIFLHKALETFLYIFLPFLSLVAVYFIGKIKYFKKKITLLRYYLNRRKIKLTFDGIYEEENEIKLKTSYVKNALNEASSTNLIKKRNALEQLTQFKHNEMAIVGLIKLLSDENDIAFRKIIITALYNVIKD